MKTEPTAEYVRSRLAYDPDTGVFRWKTNRYPSRVGQVTGAVKDGYLQIYLDGRLYRAHRLAWLIMTGLWPSDEVDHINRVRGDNRWNNLRAATKSQNAMNTSVRADNRSGFKGVAWDAGRKKWRADIRLPYVRKHLGMFESPELAHKAYVAAAAVHFGEYGRTS